MGVSQIIVPVSLLSATTEVLVPTKTLPSNAEMYVCTPVTFAFQRTVDVSGAGPAEKREKEASPMNCDHSYWSKASWAADTSVDSPETSTVFPRVEIATSIDKIKRRDKTTMNHGFFGTSIF